MHPSLSRAELEDGEKSQHQKLTDQKDPLFSAQLKQKMAMT